MAETRYVCPGGHEGTVRREVERKLSIVGKGGKPEEITLAGMETIDANHPDHHRKGREGRCHRCGSALVAVGG